MPRATSWTPNSDVIVDNTDFARIRYIDPPPVFDFIYNWRHNNASATTFYKGTNAECLQSGCGVLFEFMGTSVAVYGFEPFSVSDVQLWSSYTINGENNVTHTSGNKQANNVLFYHSGEMPFGQYTLSIYVGHAEDDASFFLDWIEYNTTSATASTSSSASHATQSEQGGNAVHPKSSLAVIIGGAVGGVVLFAVIGLCIFWWMRRRASMGDKIAAGLHAFDREQDLFAPVFQFEPGSPPPMSAFSGANFMASSPGGSSSMAGAQQAFLASHAPSSSGRPGSEITDLASASFVSDYRGCSSSSRGEKQMIMAYEQGRLADTDRPERMSPSHREQVTRREPAGDFADVPPEYTP